MKKSPDEHRAPALQHMRQVLEQLLKVKADDVVTITAPFDRHRPINDANRIVLRNLVATAKAQVIERCTSDVAAAIVKRLDEAVAGVDTTAGAYGVVIVATVDMTETHLLPFPVRPATAVTSTPAVRFIAQGLVRSPRYRLLVVSDRATRLFEGVRDDVVEILDHGFPFTADVVKRDLRAVGGRLARPTGRDDREQWRNFYRKVDQALTEESRNDPLPIIVAGVRRSTGLFQEVSRNADRVIGQLDGAREHANAHELGEAAWQIMREDLIARRGTAIAHLREMFHAGSATVGIADVWSLARKGHGRLLVVEEDYHAEPSREVGHLLVPADEDGPDVMDDPVDDVIEHVLRSGGTVEFVAADSMGDLGRIGLVAGT